MPRSGGVYTLPAGNPVVTLTVISSAWANTTMSDVATALTGSLPTDGTAPMTGALRLVDGAVGTPGLTWASETTSGWYRIGANQFGFSVATVLALSVNASRAWNIPAPAAGAALTLTNLAGSPGLNVVGAGTVPLSLQELTALPNNVLNCYVGVATAAIAPSGINGDLILVSRTSNDNSIGFATGNGGAAAFRLTISGTGNVVVASPTSGTALTVNGVNGGTPINSDTGTLTSLTNYRIAASSNTGAVWGIGLTAAPAFAISRIDVAATPFTISLTGNVTIAAPSSGIGLTVNGVASANTLVVQASTSSGNSGGMLLNAGTTSADNALVINNAAASVQYVRVAGDGSVVVGSPTGGNQGLGTLNATGLFVNGVALKPIVVVQTGVTSKITAPAIANDAVFTVAIPSAGTYQFRLDSVIAGISVGGGSVIYNINYSAGFSAGEFAGYGIFAGTTPTNSGFQISTTVAGSTTNVTSGNPGGGGATSAGGVMGTITATAAGTLAIAWTTNGAGANGNSIGQGSFVANRIA